MKPNTVIHQETIVSTAINTTTIVTIVPITTTVFTAITIINKITINIIAPQDTTSTAHEGLCKDHETVGAIVTCNDTRHQQDYKHHHYH